MNTHRLRRPLARIKIAAFLAITFAGVNSANAEVVIEPEDLIGTWEMVVEKNPKTGAVIVDAGTAIGWTQFTRSHWTVVGMRRNRSVVKAADFAKLSPEEKHKTNYARVWDEKNQQVFAARAGTYTIAGDKLHQTPMIALGTGQLGADRVLKITRLDKDTMVTQNDDPPELGFPALEITYRRID